MTVVENVNTEQQFKGVDQSQSIIALVREATNVFDKMYEGAKSVGVGTSSFRFVRRLIDLNERDNLSDGEKVKIKLALESIEQKRSTIQARSIASDVVLKYYPKRAPNNEHTRRVDSKKRKRLDATLVAIREVCGSTTDMKLPIAELSKEDREKAIITLLIASEQIGQLMQKLLGHNGEAG